MAAIGPAAEFDQLKNALETLASAVIDQMQRLESAVDRLDSEELKRIVGQDKVIDDMEMGLDNLCLRFMEMRAPIGPDFRYVVGAADIARSLERIGDCIEYVARHIGENPTLATGFPAGWAIITAMIEKCLDIMIRTKTAWKNADASAARTIPALDKDVNALQKQTYARITEDVRAGKVDVALGIEAVLIVNKLESLADVACHIAESLVYVIQARHIRHTKAPALSI